MQLKLALSIVAGALLLAGCSSTPKVNTGPIKARTFNFIDLSAKTESAFAEQRQPVHAMIQKAITQNLAARGLTKVDRGGDVTVQYLVIISDGVTTSAVNDYFGYSAEAFELQEKAHEAFAVEGKNQTRLNAGTLVIDIIDPVSKKILWRSYAWRPILGNVTDEVRQARLQEVVNEALDKLRIAQ